MKKFLATAALALGLVLAVAAPTKASTTTGTAEIALNNVQADEGAGALAVYDLDRSNFAVSYVGTNAVGINLATHSQVELYTYQNKYVGSTYAYTYASFSNLSKGQVYKVRIRSYDKYYDSTLGTYVEEYGNWTDYKTFVTRFNYKYKYTRNYKKKTKTIKFIFPKVKGISNFKVYMATSKDGKYTKVKTIKPGKSGTVKSFKKKKLSTKKYYYVKIVPTFTSKLPTEQTLQNLGYSIY